MVHNVRAVVGFFLFVCLARAAGIDFLAFVHQITGALEAVTLEAFLKDRIRFGLKRRIRCGCRFGHRLLPASVAAFAAG